ncbi:hypothetical protein EXU30_11805 [Shewanella maritima]|uniref:Inhibitor of apoptosis-promoting Bax1 n=1 Tax=Shewanella maritima TaxID=2520507 RepID=A0A411PI81_9GAMM|nr:Bax inhibitor-1 family protein [Shewanella maritima]QBF83307.1 hypothetical protein EXU30_11805 [Shewanella maritima]
MHQKQKQVQQQTRIPLSNRVISKPLYHLILGLTLCWGFGVNWWMVQNIHPTAFIDYSVLLFLGFYFGSFILGCSLFQGSSNALVSFIGFNLVVVPLGLVVNIATDGVATPLITYAMELTALVTVTMMCLSMLFPGFFKSIIGKLALVGLTLVAVELVYIFVLGGSNILIHAGMVVTFAGYIGYYWVHACEQEPTLDNAIDAAAYLYMSIINLFLRILEILKR